MIPYIDKIIKEKILEKNDFEGTKELLKLAERGNSDLVFERLKKALSEIPDSRISLLDSMACIYERLGYSDNALECYQKVYEIYPNHGTLTDIFNIYFSTERYHEALEIANKYMELYEGGKILRTKTLLRLSTPEEGLRIINEALDEIDTYQNKFAEQALSHRAALICYEKKQYKDALAYLDRAISSCKIGTAKNSHELKEKIEKKIRNKKIAMTIGFSLLGLVLVIAALYIYLIISGPVTDCDSCLNGTTP